MLWHGAGTLSSSYGQPVFAGYGAVAPGDCDAYKKLREDALRKMWKTLIFTEKRRKYELQANEYAARWEACKLKAQRKGAASFKGIIPKELTQALPGASKSSIVKASKTSSGPEQGEALVPAASSSSGPPTALIVGGGAVVLALLAFFAFKRKKGAAPAGKGSFTLSPPGGAHVAR
jgi:hypothetical protein